MKRILSGIMLLSLSVTAALSACAPKMISEAKAEEAGIALINHAFGVNETEAKVKLRSAARPDGPQSNTNGNSNQTVDRYYSVTVPDGTYDGFLYDAEVNAQTGTAYFAEMNKGLFPSLTPEQKDLIDRLGAEHGLKSSNIDRELLENAGFVATEWITQTFQPKQRITEVINESIFSDNGQEPLTDINDAIVLEDGTIYYVTVIWPMMQIQRVFIFNQGVQ
ncbi:MAG: hypothetical protein VB062_01300 [Christensenella sp.]|nr:hypothetical protein [Christensenella sp.]